MSTSQKVKPDPGSLELEHRRQRRRSKGKTIGAFAVVAAIGLASVASSIFGALGGQEATTTADRAPTVAARTSPPPTTAGADSIESGFIGRHALTVEGVRFSLSVPTPGWDKFGSISINKSIVGPQGAEAIIYWTSFADGDYADPCVRLLSPPVGASAADLAAAVSTAPGTKLVKGPSDVALGGRPAKHVVLAVRENVGCDPGFFYAWRDVELGALWPTTGVGDTIRVWIVDVDGARLFIAAATTEQASSELEKEIQQIIRSIRFGEPTSQRENVTTSRMVRKAANFMEARNAHHARKAMSLLADDGVRARLLWNNKMDPNMPAVLLSHDEIALALAAERLYQARYERVRCRYSGKARVTCSYLLDSRLRRIAGLAPVTSISRFGFRDGRINRLSFPWLNVSFNPGGYYPAEFGRFVRWLEAEHPEAGGPGDRGELFRTAGQELIHVLTPESLGLLAGYLEEYERSRSG
jgi:hypothetical protein